MPERIAYHELLGFELRIDNTLGGPGDRVLTQAGDKATLELLNNEDDAIVINNSPSYGTNDAFWTWALFPESFDLTGARFVIDDPWDDSGSNISVLQSGTWNTVKSNFRFPITESNWDTDIMTDGAPWLACDGIAFRIRQAYNYRIRMLHIYGAPSDTSGKLRLWDPTLDQEYGNWINLGDLYPGDVVTETFRVKNNYTSTASAPLVSAYDLTGNMADGIQFSTDDITYTNTVTLSDIAPGTISPLIYCRRTVPNPVTYQTRAAWISVVPNTWT